MSKIGVKRKRITKTEDDVDLVEVKLEQPEKKRKFKLNRDEYNKKMETMTKIHVEYVVGEVDKNLKYTMEKAIESTSDKITLYEIYSYTNRTNLFESIAKSQTLRDEVIELIKKRCIVENSIQLEWTRYYSDENNSNDFHQISLYALMSKDK